MKVNDLLMEEIRWVLYLNNKPAAHYSTELEAKDQAELLIQRFKDTNKPLPKINITKKNYGFN